VAIGADPNSSRAKAVNSTRVPENGTLSFQLKANLMNWAALLSSFIGSLPGLATSILVSILTLQLTKRINQSTERLKTALQQDIVKFSKWHEKRCRADHAYQDRTGTLGKSRPAGCDHAARLVRLSRLRIGPQRPTGP
jgi:hypothetical protein